MYVCIDKRGCCTLSHSDSTHTYICTWVQKWLYRSIILLLHMSVYESVMWERPKRKIYSLSRLLKLDSKLWSHWHSSTSQRLRKALYKSGGDEWHRKVGLHMKACTGMVKEQYSKVNVVHRCFTERRIYHRCSLLHAFAAEGIQEKQRVSWLDN